MLLAWIVAIVTTLGSLYYSLHAGFVPCELCWYQRIAMYPLVVVLGVGWLRRDRKAWITALPFVVVGVPLSLYHWLVERVPSFAESSSCSAFAPCTAPYFEKLGFVTLAWMCLSSFLLIGTMLALFVTAQRTRGARVGCGDRRYRGSRRHASRGAGDFMNQKAKVNQKHTAARKHGGTSRTATNQQRNRNRPPKRYGTSGRAPQSHLAGSSVVSRWCSSSPS